MVSESIQKSIAYAINDDNPDGLCREYHPCRIAYIVIQVIFVLGLICCVVFVLYMLACLLLYFPGLLMELILSKQGICPSITNTTFNHLHCTKDYHYCMFKFFIGCSSASFLFWAAVTFAIIVVIAVIVKCITFKKQHLFYSDDNPNGPLLYLGDDEEEEYDTNVFTRPICFRYIATKHAWCNIIGLPITVALLITFALIGKYYKIQLGYLGSHIFASYCGNYAGNTSYVECKDIPICLNNCGTLGILILIIMLIVFLIFLGIIWCGIYSSSAFKSQKEIIRIQGEKVPLVNVNTNDK
jgi:hypothetical protein